MPLHCSTKHVQLASSRAILIAPILNKTSKRRNCRVLNSKGTLMVVPCESTQSSTHYDCGFFLNNRCRNETRHTSQQDLYQEFLHEGPRPSFRIAGVLPSCSRLRRTAPVAFRPMSLACSTQLVQWQRLWQPLRVGKREYLQNTLQGKYGERSGNVYMTDRKQRVVEKVWATKPYFGSFAAICSHSERYPARSASCS